MVTACFGVVWLPLAFFFEMPVEISPLNCLSSHLFRLCTFDLAMIRSNWGMLPDSAAMRRLEHVCIELPASPPVAPWWWDVTSDCECVTNSRTGIPWPVR
jgi:hypothetical protein